MAPNQGGTVSVVVVDEFPIERLGLRSLMAGFPGYEVVGEAGDLPSAEQLARDERPDLVVIDPMMAHGDAFRALAALREQLPEARILVLAKSADPEIAMAAIRGGADGFLVKTVTQAALLAAVTRLMAGEAVIDPDLAMQVMRAGPAIDPRAAMPDPLTPREHEVLRLISQGRTNPQIAHQLFMAVGTVKVHVEHIIGKLGAADRTDAAVRAAGLGLLRPSQDEEESATRHMPTRG
jgi:DNA-binding NarL/FixJ family response regulator